VVKVMTLQIVYKSHFLDQIYNSVVGERNSGKEVSGVRSEDF
jgi:hypothetical protein